MTLNELIELGGFRQMAVLQSAGFVVEFLLFLAFMKRAYPWREAGRALLIAIPAAVVWGLQDRLFLGWSAALSAHRVCDLPLGGLPRWGLAFLAAELHFYVMHRLWHRVNWLWADHQVHHATTDLNIFDGNRGGWTLLLAGGFSTLLLPLTLVGFSGFELLFCSNLILQFQFYIHSQAIPRLGPLEYLLMTPGNHRVHHARNPEYLDCNYGGMTMLFDRLFGSFVAERADVPIEFGLIEHEAVERNVLQSVSDGWVTLGRTLWRCRSAKQVFMTLFGPPGWSADGRTRTTDQIKEDAAKRAA